MNIDAAEVAAIVTRALSRGQRIEGLEHELGELK